MDGENSDRVSTLEEAYSDPNLTLTRRYVLCGALSLITALGLGFFYSLTFLKAYPFEGIEFLSASRVRMGHTFLMVQGFVMNLIWAGANWCLPRWVPEWKTKLGLDSSLFWAWQAGVLVSVLGILNGGAQGVEWAESPVPLDPFLAIIWIFFWFRYALPFWQSSTPQPVSSACLHAGITWCALTFFMANFGGGTLFPGDRGEAFNLLVVHEFLGMGVAYIGIGFFYHFFPLLLGRPLFSQRLAWLGFWLMALFYPLHGLSLFVEEALPYWDQGLKVLVLCAVGLGGVSVFLNTLLTFGINFSQIKNHPSLLWWLGGIFFYFITGVQVVWQSTPESQKLIHFSDWVISHSHVSLFGVFGFFANGLLIFITPKIVGAPWLQSKLNVYCYVLVIVGLIGLGVSLALAGLQQGAAWQVDQNWQGTLDVSNNYWLLRTIFGFVLIAGQALLLLHFLFTYRYAVEKWRKERA